MSGTLPPGRLVTELLGFPPELLLDDMVNVMHNSVQEALDAVQAILTAWLAHKRDNDDLRLEVEEGIIAFQTLLESHIDIAADGFEMWALRNIFTLEPGSTAGAEDPRISRHVVVPHHKGLNLDTTSEAESKAWQEIDELRRKIASQRRLRALLKAGVRASGAEADRSLRRLDRFEFLRYLTEDPELDRLPDHIVSLLGALQPPPSSQKPSLDDLVQVSSQAAAQQKPPVGGPRGWEASKAGYVHWAVKRVLMADSESQPSTAILENAVARSAEIADSGDLRSALETMGVKVKKLGGLQEEDEDAMDMN